MRPVPPRVELGTFPVALRHVVRHAAASHSHAANIIVMVEDRAGLRGWGEGCPRPFVSGETVAGAAAFLRAHAPALVAEARDPAGLALWIDEHRRQIDAAPAAFCAIELALLDLFGRQRGVPVEVLLGGTPGTVPLGFTAVFGNRAPLATRLLALRYRIAGLRAAKLKIGTDSARNRANLAALRGFAPLRLDANNAWPDAQAAIEGLHDLPRCYDAVEEPVAAGDLAGARRVAGALGLPVVLDESLLRVEQVAALDGPPTGWIANLRVSKLGGLHRAIAVARAAEHRGIPVIIGAQVGETSLLTRAGLALDALLSVPALAHEGAFGTRLLAQDLVAEPLMFGRSGWLDPALWTELSHPGLGLDVRAERLHPLS